MPSSSDPAGGEGPSDGVPAALCKVARCGSRSVGQLPGAPGAYLLAIRLSVPRHLNLPRLGQVSLPAGWYAYAGSARGPGGIRARVGRHLRPGKTVRWHVDHLTLAASELRAFPVIDGRECDVLGALLAQPGCRVAHPGFGSSDCRRCPSHLLALE